MSRRRQSSSRRGAPWPAFFKSFDDSHLRPRPPRYTEADLLDDDEPAQDDVNAPNQEQENASE